MTSWLLDTNVLSELRRPRPEPKVVAFVARQPLESLFVSEVTFAEIRYGIERVSDVAKRADLQDWLARQVRPIFVGRALPITEEIMLRWRLLMDTGRRTGHTFSQPDLIIAATALHHGLVVVTRDRGEYDRAGAAVLQPWIDPTP